MSKAEVLRGFVTERLAAASREILAAVDRLVAGYEEEASGFRLELGRQRRQLEALLQPRVTLRKTGVKCSRSLGPAEQETAEESPEPPENLEDPTNQTSSRGQNKKRKLGRPHISETQSHVNFRIRILEDSQTDVLSDSVLKKHPALNLKCTRGLRQSDFLDLLRSTFPQLSGGNNRFDLFTADKRRRLQPLKLTALTVEDIHRNISNTGWGKSTLYIRLKDAPVCRAKDSGDSLSTTTLMCDETGPQTSSTSHQQDFGEEDVDDEGPRTLEAAEDLLTGSASESKAVGSDSVENNEGSGGDWKPDESDLKERDSKTSKRQKARRSGVKAAETKPENRDVVLACKVCGGPHGSEVTLVKHAWSHVDDPGSVCGVCGQLPESLKDHLQSEHKTYNCHICGESFLCVLGLDEHVAAHSGAKPYECDVCRDVFALKVSLENHQKLHKAGKLHRCYTCHKVFELREQLKAHCRTHGNKKTHLCGVCGKSLSDYRSLSRHKYTHSGERPHSCQICGRRFKLIGTLRQHEKIHTDRERMYLCDVCCKMFLTSKQLQIHMRTHTDEKPYQCGECGKGFTTKGPLTIHMRVHTGESPYRCPDCGWCFKRKTHLDNHVTVHSGHKPFVCGICGKACARKTYLTVHMRTHNGERPYKCTLCDKAFTQSHCLKTHLKSHQGAEAAT